jgi:hypothetical protein
MSITAAEGNPSELRVLIDDSFKPGKSKSPEDLSPHTQQQIDLVGDILRVG